MFPLRDSTQRVHFPLINVALIIVTILAFFVEISAKNIEDFIFQYAFISAQFNLFDPESHLRLISSMFLHGGVFHLISNVWFLHIFGDNIEDRLGHIRYLLFYIAAGYASTLTQYFIAPESIVPLLGASGAISGVAGAYYVWYKRSQVETLVLFVFVWTVVRLPAPLMLGYWFVTQVFAGFGSLANFDPNAGGVAFFAHIGGFVFGYLFARLRQSDR